MNTTVNKRRYLYLYLAVACLIGIILIFVFDGYLGRHMILTMDNGRYPQTIESGWWEDEPYQPYYSFSGERGDVFTFTLEVENRKFRSFDEPVRVFLTDSNGVETEVISGVLSAGSFDSGELSWKISTSELFPADFPENNQLTVTMVMQVGEFEGSVKLFVYNSGLVVPKG